MLLTNESINTRNTHLQNVRVVEDAVHLRAHHGFELPCCCNRSHAIGCIPAHGRKKVYVRVAPDVDHVVARILVPHELKLIKLKNRKKLNCIHSQCHQMWDLQSLGHQLQYQHVITLLVTMASVMLLTSLAKSLKASNISQRIQCSKACPRHN